MWWWWWHFFGGVLHCSEQNRHAGADRLCLGYDK